MDVEATELGYYCDSGYFDVWYGQRLVASLPMSFMHDGVPQLELEAVWTAPDVQDIRVEDTGVADGTFLKRMLSRLNICSKEYIIRQYDHEVRGGSVIKIHQAALAEHGVENGEIGPAVHHFCSSLICSTMREADSGTYSRQRSSPLVIMRTISRGVWNKSFWLK